MGDLWKLEALRLLYFSDIGLYSQVLEKNAKVHKERRKQRGSG